MIVLPSDKLNLYFISLHIQNLFKLFTKIISLVLLRFFLLFSLTVRAIVLRILEFEMQNSLIYSADKDH